jgi:protein-tyrosine phosphatase
VLVEDYELRVLAIPGLVDAARARGVEVLRLPIPDGGLPPDVGALRGLLAAIQAHVAAGGNAVIHCRGGLGRAGTVGGCLLVECGVDADGALLRLIAARGPSCPENAAQRAFVRGWAATRGRG